MFDFNSSKSKLNRLTSSIKEVAEDIEATEEAKHILGDVAVNKSRVLTLDGVVSVKQVYLSRLLSEYEQERKALLTAVTDDLLKIYSKSFPDVSELLISCMKNS